MVEEGKMGTYNAGMHVLQWLKNLWSHVFLKEAAEKAERKSTILELNQVF